MMLDWLSCRIGARRSAPRGRARRTASIAGLLMCACYSTCDGSPPSATATGELGNGTFEYRCIGTSDPVCETGITGQTWPDCIAQGGEFRLDYTLRDISEVDDDEILPFLHIEAANDEFFEGGGGTFRGGRVGRSAFLAYDNDIVVDLIHMDVVAPDAIEVVALDPADPVDELQLEVGDVAIFRVFPRAATCPDMGGAITPTVESSDAKIAAAGVLDVLEISARSPGTATVTVRHGELTHEMTVVVEGTVRTNPQPSSANDDSSSGDDVGTGSDSGSDSGGSESSDSGSESGTSGSTGG